MQEYDRRHGYRGPEGYADLPAQANEEALEEALQDVADSDDLYAAVVVEASPKLVKAYRQRRRDASRSARRGSSSPRACWATRRARTSASGAARSSGCRRTTRAAGRSPSCPRSKSALVSVDPRDGAVRALVGGFDFNRNQYNHVTQALRQPGSSFKPFIYSAALEKGFTPATIINDAPLTFTAAQTGSEPWEPKNYDGKFEGPMRLRTALAKSKNLVSMRILQAIGPQYAQDYIDALRLRSRSCIRPTSRWRWARAT